MQHAATGPGPYLPQSWLRVADADRDDVVRLLQQAYAEGRIDDGEFDTRVGQALAARTHGDLRGALRGLVSPAHRVPAPATAAAAPPAVGERFAALAVHWSGYLASFVVPLAVFLAERDRSSHLRAQAAEAANFQLTFVLVNIAATVLVLPVLLLPFVWIGWLVLTLVGGVAAVGSNGFRYPCTLRLLR